MTGTNEEDPHEIFVPGRICLFGEHCDWAGMYRSFNESIETGICLIAGTNQGLFARVLPHATKLVLTCTLDQGQQEKQPQPQLQQHIELELDDLLSEATSTSIFSYMAGVAYQIRRAYPSVGGIVINNYQTTLPVKKGLSSSAAICVLTARAYSLCYGLNFTKQQEMEFAYLGERTTPSKCGRMDQGCAYGQQPILMEFNGNDMKVRDDVVIAAPIYLILVDLRAAKNTPAILCDLQKAYPIPETDLHQGLHDLLGPINHQIMKRALLALKEGDSLALGQLMTFAQEQFDTHAMPLSPLHLTSPVLHKLLHHSSIQPFVYGGKGVGSQGDGSAQFVAKTEQDQWKAIEIIEEDFGMHCMPMTLPVASLN